jgi:hypothetical protein
MSSREYLISMSDELVIIYCAAAHGVSSVCLAPGNHSIMCSIFLISGHHQPLFLGLACPYEEDYSTEVSLVICLVLTIM